MISQRRLREAMALHQKGLLAEASEKYRHLLAMNPNDANLYNLLGVISCQTGNFEDAVSLIEQAIAIDPTFADFYQNLGSTYQRWGKSKKAEGLWSENVRLLEKALAAYDRLLILQPNNGMAMISRGLTLEEGGHYAHALPYFDKALTLNPKDTVALQARAGALNRLGRSRDAIDCFDKVLEIYQAEKRPEPEIAAIHYAKSFPLLRSGNLSEGWKDYEWRWQDPGFESPRHVFSQPLWRGESVKKLGGALLVTAEQGYGDIIQFARYVLLLAGYGYEVIFEVYEPLYRLFQEGFKHPLVTIVPHRKQGIERPFAAHIPLLSLPERFRTDFRNIPTLTPYLSVAAEIKTYWSQRLAPKKDRLQVGLVWAGSKNHPFDFERSIPGKKLLPLLQNEEIVFYSLQKEKRDDVFTAPNFIDLSMELKDFTDTAAIIEALDLVISVDTSVVHLAGALDCPTWLLAAAVPDWRWGEAGKRSDWYPSLKIFRQKTLGNWDSVITDVQSNLVKVKRRKLR